MDITLYTSLYDTITKQKLNIKTTFFYHEHVASIFESGEN